MTPFFTADLNGAQVIIAVLLFRIAENRRKRPAADAPEFIRYRWWLSSSVNVPPHWTCAVCGVRVKAVVSNLFR